MYTVFNSLVCMGDHDTMHPSEQRLSKLRIYIYIYIYIKRPVSIHEKKLVYQKPKVSIKQALCFINIYWSLLLMHSVS
jgi:hypothetical protein